ncbi:hypothetical protein ILUMI_08713, partial [Ignelater luminosus]
MEDNKDFSILPYLPVIKHEQEIKIPEKPETKSEDNEDNVTPYLNFNNPDRCFLLD